VHADPVFGLGTPAQISGVPDDVLEPRRTWPDGAAYDAQAAKLAGMFRENFKTFEKDVVEAVRAAGP
jgi:phosphoenolpyruvate carboxykinase (ATP)